MIHVRPMIVPHRERASRADETTRARETPTPPRATAGADARGGTDLLVAPPLVVRRPSSSVVHRTGTSPIIPSSPIDPSTFAPHECPVVSIGGVTTYLPGYYYESRLFIQVPPSGVFNLHAQHGHPGWRPNGSRRFFFGIPSKFFDGSCTIKTVVQSGSEWVRVGQSGSGRRPRWTRDDD